MADSLFTREFSRWQYLTLGRNDYLLKRKNRKKKLQGTLMVWYGMEFRAFRVKKTSFKDELPFCQSEGQSSISKDFSSCGLSEKCSSTSTSLKRVNFTFDCKFVPKELFN